MTNQWIPAAILPAIERQTMNSTSRASGDLPDDGDDMYSLQQYSVVSVIFFKNLKTLKFFSGNREEMECPVNPLHFRSPGSRGEHGMSPGLLTR
jgi:hypothetical protein